MNRMLSVIIPVYNEEASLPKLYEGVVANIKKLLNLKKINDYEIIFISDGCSDGSDDVIEKLSKKDEKVSLYVLRRNFGKSRALQIGFKRANGDVIITMDGDLQDDPKEFVNFINKIDEGYDLVSGWKYNRLDPLEKRLPSKLFNAVTSKFSGIGIHDFNCGFKAYRKEVVKNVCVYGEFHRYIPVLAKREGFKVAEIQVEHHKREFGKSKFGVERYLRGLFDAFSAIFLLKYWDRPMYFFGKIGLLLLMLGMLICSYLTIIWFGGASIGGRPLLVLGVLFILVGIQSISLGLIANIIVDQSDKKQNDASCIKEIVRGGGRQ